MANGYAKTILVGNLVRDIELKYVGGGKTALCDLSIAVNDRIKKNGDYVEETSFFDVVLFGKTAEIANQYLSKGSMVMIEGTLRQERWESDGQKRSKVKVVGDKMLMLGGRGEGGGKPASSGGYSAPEGFEPDPDTSGTGDPECPF